MRDEATLDELRGYDLRIHQPRDGYRFSLEPLILCDFAAVRGGERVIDLGAGCGVIPLVLARRSAGASIVGVEFQQEMAALAERNVELNGLSDRIEILGCDVLDLRKRFPVSAFDLVVGNPPYRTPGTGRVSPRAGRDAARHETTATLADFLAIGKYLVRPGGRACFIYHVSRLPELFTEARSLKFAPVRLRIIHGSAAADGRMALIELVKGRRCDLMVLPPLLVYGDNGSYSDEMKRILGEQDA